MLIWSVELRSEGYETIWVGESRLHYKCWKGEGGEMRGCGSSERPPLQASVTQFAQRLCMIYGSMQVTVQVTLVVVAVYACLQLYVTRN